MGNSFEISSYSMIYASQWMQKADAQSKTNRSMQIDFELNQKNQELVKKINHIEPIAPYQRIDLFA